MPGYALFSATFHSLRLDLPLLVVVVTVAAVRDARALPLAGHEHGGGAGSEEPDICKTYPLLHLCLIRPMLNGALAEINYLVNSVAFVNNGPDGFYMSESRFADATGERDQAQGPDFSPPDTRPSFILQDDPQPALTNPRQHNEPYAESSTRRPADATTAGEHSRRDVMPDYVVQATKKHKRHIAVRHLTAQPGLPRSSVEPIKPTADLQTRSLFARPPPASRRKKLAAPKAAADAQAAGAQPKSIDAANFIAEWIRSEKRKRLR